ncbi:glutaminase [Marinigracilibium pacificum]|uniref:Glutaminase n=1 Tax=Marinigracilibium pacificum TaxID=2729599 RepID=A0A848IT63_9BACT|nr:glutaminase [Marinigracilibium pacificum]NMM47527.1 glutaminase [Marinigracilibium pacificum]
MKALGMTFDYRKIFREIADDTTDMNDLGHVADYIPELKHINPEKFGVHLTTLDNHHYDFGDASEKFSIQSIAKVFSLILAFKNEGVSIWNRVGVEPSGSPFNSLVQLEYEKGIPRNPFINAGALVVSDILISYLENPKEEFLSFVRLLANSNEINYNKSVAESEKSTGERNSALVHFMKSFGNIENDPDQVLDFYFYLCSVEMNCIELSRAFLFLANRGTDPLTNNKILTPSKAKRVNAIMQMCGFYDEAGDFAFKVGLPGKSGVGGGIAAVLPGEYSIAVWSPRLNSKGNSYKGMKFLEKFTTKTNSSIF